MTHNPALDRALVRLLRIIVWGCGMVMALIIVYIVVAAMSSAHDNRRIDELEKRVDKLERAKQ